MKSKLFLGLFILLQVIFSSTSFAADKIRTAIFVGQDKDEEVVAEDFERYIYDSLKDAIEKEGYEVMEKAIVKAKLKKAGMKITDLNSPQEIGEKLNADIIVAAVISRFKGGMEEFMYQRELKEYKERGGCLYSYRSTPSPVYISRSRKKYALTYKWILVRQDKIMHMGIVGGNSMEEMAEELSGELIKFMPDFKYLKGQVLKKADDIVEIDFGRESGIEVGKQVVIFAKKKNDLKDLFRIPGDKNYERAKIIIVMDEFSVCQVLSNESLSKIQEGDVVEYISKNVPAESKNEKSPFSLFFEMF